MSKPKFSYTRLPDPFDIEGDFALRVELGCDLPMGPMRFLRAMDRARQVADATFHGASRLTVAAEYFAHTKRHSTPARAFKTLSKLGFRGSFDPPRRLVPQNDGDREREAEGRVSYVRCADFPNDSEQIGLLLWMAVANEMPIKPQLSWLSRTYMFDMERGVALHVYDDRGMDLMATSKAALLPIYTQFNEWLLDYDRPWMEPMFAD